jgi:hypothetical protein
MFKPKTPISGRLGNSSGEWTSSPLLSTPCGQWGFEPLKKKTAGDGRFIK